MEVLQDGVLAFLAATGLAALFWLLTGWLRRREPARVMLLIPARPGAGPPPPGRSRTARWGPLPAAAAAGPASGPPGRQLRGAVPIVLCDCGLEGADLRRARELTERYDDLLLLTAAEIPDHLP